MNLLLYSEQCLVTQKEEDNTGPSPFSPAHIAKDHNEASRKKGENELEHIMKNITKIDIHRTNKHINLD